MKPTYTVLITTPNTIWEKIFTHNRESLTACFDLICVAVAKNSFIRAEIISSRDGQVYLFEK